MLYKDQVRADSRLGGNDRDNTHLEDFHKNEELRMVEIDCMALRNAFGNRLDEFGAG